MNKLILLILPCSLTYALATYNYKPQLFDLRFFNITLEGSTDLGKKNYTIFKPANLSHYLEKSYEPVIQKFTLPSLLVYPISENTQINFRPGTKYPRPSDNPEVVLKRSIDEIIHNAPPKDADRPAIPLKLIAPKP